MAVTQYVGPKIVPHGFTDWNATTAYDGLYCAYYGYQWYIACNGPVPVGVSPVDREYWAPYSLNSGDIQNITAKVNSLFPQTYLSDGTDLNTITEPGKYLLASASAYGNMAPISSPGDGILEVEKIGDTGLYQTIYAPAKGVNRSMTRYYGNINGVTTWSKWQEIGSGIFNPVERLEANTDLNNLNKVGTYMLYIPNGNYQHLPSGLVWDSLNPDIATLEVIPALDKQSGIYIVTQRLTLAKNFPIIYQRTVNTYADNQVWTDWFRMDGDFNFYSTLEVEDANIFFSRDITVVCKTGTNCPNYGTQGVWYNLSWIGTYQFACPIGKSDIFFREYSNNSFKQWRCLSNQWFPNMFPFKQMNTSLQIAKKTTLSVMCYSGAIISIIYGGLQNQFVEYYSNGTNVTVLRGTEADNIHVSKNTSNLFTIQNESEYTITVNIFGNVENLSKISE